jgi:hypothetical protein
MNSVIPQGNGNYQPALSVPSGEAVQKPQQGFPGLRLQSQLPQGFRVSAPAPVVSPFAFPAGTLSGFTLCRELVVSLAGTGILPVFTGFTALAGRLWGKALSRDRPGIPGKTFRAQFHPLAQGGCTGEGKGLPAYRAGVFAGIAAGMAAGIAAGKGSAGEGLPPDIG